MNGFFANVLIWMRRFKFWVNDTSEPIYHPDVLEAAEFDNCDPSEIVWCSDCEAHHKGYY